MNPKLQKLGTAAALLVMAATGQAGADTHHGDTKPLLAVSLSVADGQLPLSMYAVRLYPIEQGDRLSEVAASVRPVADPAIGGKGVARSAEISAKERTLLPEPGKWSMFLAGLLGVGAIARRRMSA
jgi:hypothetical protein